MSIRDNVITVTELIAIARPAKAGSNVIPNAGYKTPAATGIKIELYANAQKMFSLILRITFLEN